MDAGDNEKVYSVIDTVVLAVNPLEPSAIAILVGFGKREVMGLLWLIQSLLKLPEDPDSSVLHHCHDDLEQTLLSLPSYTFNLKPVKDLEARIKNHIIIALEYACKSWHNHAIEVRGNFTTVVSRCAAPCKRSF